MPDRDFCPEWVSEAKQGNQQAIENLYICAWQEVHIVICSMIHTDDATIQDLVQDTFVKVFQRLDQLHDPQKYRAWVKQIARNTALDHLKRSKAILFSELSGEDGIPVDFEDEDMSHQPDMIIDQMDTARLLKELLDALSHMQRTVFSLFYIEEKTIKEIAAILGSKEGTIKNHLYKARENLQKKIRSLEQKENIKLYSMSPLAFLLLLLRNMDSKPDMALLGNVLGSTHATAAAGTAADGSAAKTAGGFAAKKILAGILAAVTLAGSVSVYSIFAKLPNEQNPEYLVSAETESPTESVEQVFFYEDLVHYYTAVICGQYSVDEGRMALSMYTNNTTPFGSYIGADGYFVVSDGVQYYLAEYDINCDEINELLLLEETASNDSEWVTEILDIFTFYNGEPIWLIAGEYRGTIDLCEDGVIRFVGSGGAEAHIYDFYKILNGKLDLCDRAEENWGVYMVNGEECSVDKFNHTIDKYPLRDAPDYDLIEVITP